MLRRPAFLLVLLFIASSAAAQNNAPPCAQVPAYQQLDFWVGAWTVTDAQGQQVGTNRIEKILDGCAVMEHWTASNGSEGKSLFYYDGTVWKQVWVTEHATAQGGLKEKQLVETLDGGGVRFQGNVPLPGGGTTLDRTTLTPLPDSLVRQVIETSSDGGKTWQTRFDATYTPGIREGIGDVLYGIIAEDGAEAAVAEYSRLKAEQPDAYDFAETQLNALGYRLMGEHRYEDAIVILKLNAEAYPTSLNVYDSLAEAYLKGGYPDESIPLYRKVLAMLPDASLPPNVKDFYRSNAESAIFIAEHFDSPGAEVLHYVAFYGGGPAGTWDLENLRFFKEAQPERAVSYQGFDLYRSPVPTHIDAIFNTAAGVDVASSFIGGVLRERVEQGDIADLGDLWQEQGWDSVFPEPFRRMASYDGKPYFVPQAFQWNPIWYRKDVFQELRLQPPQTWDELLDLIDALRAAGYVPFTISGGQWPPPMARWFTTLNLRLNGPEFHEQVMRGEVPYTDARLRSVFEHWQTLFEHGAFADSSAENTYAQGVQALVEGEAVMYNLGEWLFESLGPDSFGGRGPEVAAQLDFFAFPTLNPDVTPAEIVHAYGAFMRAGTDHPEAARDLLAFLGSAASQQTNAETLHRLNANTGVGADVYADVQRRAFDHVKETPVLVPLFEFSTRPAMAQAGLQAFVRFWRNPDDIDAVLADLEAARQTVFSPTP